MELLIDIIKGAGMQRGPLNTGKLVRKPVQVKGKNGKTFTRMQWVDPNTGQPASMGKHSPDLGNQEVKNTDEPKLTIPMDSYKEPDLEKTKKKVYDLNTQEGYLEQNIDKMDKDEKRALAHKHNLTWTHNDYDAIEHKNMVMALKEHMKANPHLLGAEHLPKAAEGVKETPTAILDSNNWLNNVAKNAPDKIYEMMKKFNIVPEDGVDPRTVPEYGPKDTGGNGMAPIMHMHNMMKLKKYLNENPNEMDNEQWTGSRMSPHTGEVEKTTVKDNKVDTGFNVQHLLRQVPRGDKYALAKQLGIVDRDPQDVPELVENGSHAVEHARNMTKLARAVERDPDLIDMDKYGVDKDHQELLRDNAKHKFLEDDIKQTMKDMPADMRKEVLEKYSKEEDFPAITESGNPQIDNMRSSGAIQKYFALHPDAFEPYKDKVTTTNLMKYPIGNKTMGRVLKHFFGIRGAGDVANNHDEESGEREWTFGVGNGSWARVEQRKGKAILSVVDTGKDEQEWNEYAVDMSKVKGWIEAGEPKHTESLVNKPLAEIASALHRNFNHFYTPEVGEHLKPTVLGAWESSGYGNDPEALTQYFHSMDVKDIGKLLDKLGVPLKDGKIATDSNRWKKFAWGDRVENTKSKNANDYVFNVNGKPELYVLHSSASQWSPAELAEARKDILGKNYEIEGIEGMPGGAEKKEKLLGLTHKGTEHIPFDLLSDMMISNGLKIKFATKKDDGAPISGSRYSHQDKTLYLDHSFTGNDLNSATHPLDVKSNGGQTITLDNGESVSTVPSSLSEDLAHEFAHALHYHLSEGDLRNGMVNPTGKKYLGEHTGAISASYNTAMRTNPRHLVGEASDAQGNHLYYYHKDHWIDSSEGRIYGDSYTPGNPNSPIQRSAKTGALVDTGYASSVTGHGNARGAEHFANSVARYAGALQSYQRYKEANPGSNSTMEEWARDMADAHKNRGYGTDWDAASSGGDTLSYKEANDASTDEVNGFLYHNMLENHKTMSKAIDRLLNRSDSQMNGIDTGKMTERYENGDFVRKGLYIYLDGGDTNEGSDK